jgi:hypothetical protein
MQVVKMTEGKVRLRNDGEKNWSDSNSKWAEKGDIITVTGAVYAENFEGQAPAEGPGSFNCCWVSPGWPISLRKIIYNFALRAGPSVT